MSDFLSDLRYSFRTLITTPAFTVTAIAALALGIGANTAIFTVVNAVLLKPLTYPEPDRMVQFMNTFPDGNGPVASPVNFNTWRAQTSVFQDVTAYDFGGPGFNLTGLVPEQVHGIHASEAYFRLFGAPVVLGRTFTPQEDSPNGGHVVVIGYGFWQRKFGGNPNIVGTSLSLSNEPYTIVGVLGKIIRHRSPGRYLGSLPDRAQQHQLRPLLSGLRPSQTRREPGPGQRPAQTDRRSVPPPPP